MQNRHAKNIPNRRRIRSNSISYTSNPVTLLSRMRRQQSRDGVRLTACSFPRVLAQLKCEQKNHCMNLTLEQWFAELDEFRQRIPLAVLNDGLARLRVE